MKLPHMGRTGTWEGPDTGGRGSVAKPRSYYCYFESSKHLTMFSPSDRSTLLADWLAARVAIPGYTML